MGRSMDGAAIAEKNVYPIRQTVEEPEPVKQSWFIRATNWLGITMARTDPPHSWSFNPATITLAITIAGGLILGGYLWGENVTERRNLLQRIEKNEEELRRTKELKLVQAGQQAGHPEPKETK